MFSSIVCQKITRYLYVQYGIGEGETQEFFAMILYQTPPFYFLKTN